MAWVRRADIVHCSRCKTPMVEGVEQTRIVHTESRCADLLAKELSSVSGHIELLETLLASAVPYLNFAADEVIEQGPTIAFLVGEIRKALDMLPKEDP